VKNEEKAKGWIGTKRFGANVKSYVRVTEQKGSAKLDRVPGRRREERCGGSGGTQHKKEEGGEEKEGTSKITG